MNRFFFWKRKQKKTDDPTNSEGVPKLLTGDAEQDEQSLPILLESIAEVSTGLELDQVLGDIAVRSLEVTHAERALLLLGENPDSLHVRTARDSSGRDLGAEPDYSHSVVKRSIEERRAGQYRVHTSAEALQLGQSVFDLKLRTVMCAPLEVQGRLIGVIYVDSKAARGEFSSRDVALFDALSAQLAIAVENARLHEDSLEKVRLEKDIEIARQIQMHLLPPVPNDVPGLEVALHFAAVSEASGDAYDFVPVGKHKLAVMIGDVTGHGVGAALLTHAAQAAVRSYLELIDDLGDVTNRLNNRLVHGVEPGMFFSMLLFVVDTEARTLSYVNAGHPPLYLVQEGCLKGLEKTGMVLGVVEHQKYEVHGPIPLNRGDLVFVATDGAEETMNSARETFGVDRLKEFLVENRDASVDAILDELASCLRKHAGGQQAEDDVTMISLRIG